MQSDHLVFLDGKPRIFLTEWIPIGAHFVYNLQKKLGCHLPRNPCDCGHQEAGGAAPEGNFYITSEVDREPNAAVLHMGTSEVRVRVLEYRHMEYIRLESRIDIADTGGDLQEEVVGIEISHDGRVSYGIELDGACSLDDIAHIMADLIEDTSAVMNTLLNTYQRRLLDVVFHNESRHRDKHVVLVADGLRTSDRPLTAMCDLLGNADYRAELAQVLGRLDLGNAQALRETGYLVPGESGMLMVSRDVSGMQDLLLACSLMNSMSMFVTNVFSRISWSWDCLNEQERRIRNEGSASIMDIQTQLSELSEEQVLVMSVPAHVRRDKAHIVRWMEESDVPGTAARLGFASYNYVRQLFDNLDERVVTAEESIRTLGEEIRNIRALASNLSEKETFHMNRAMRVLTVFSVVFLPLSLIAGIYGMNFQAYRDAGRSCHAPWNMPELYWIYGYPFALGLMVVVAAVLVLYFRRMGLLGARQPGSKNSHP